MEQCVRTRMAELRLVCEKEIATQQQRADSALNSFRKSLQLIKSTSLQAADDQVKLGRLKGQLRELEDELVKAIAAKTRKEAKQMSISDSIATTNVKVEELKRVVQELEVRKDEYTAIVSQQLDALAASEERIKEDAKRKDEIEEALEWYNRVLGFHIEGGHGVKFTFTNINKECPSEEFSFTIRHANDMYTLLECNPQLDDVEDLVRELNKTNGLFRFVRIIRPKFLKAVGLGSSSQCTPCPQASAATTLSMPVESVATDQRSESTVPARETRKNRNAGHVMFPKFPVESPASDLPVRRSARLKAKK